MSNQIAQLVTAVEQLQEHVKALDKQLAQYLAPPVKENPVQRFVEEECTLGTYIVRKDNVYHAYTVWCKREGYTALCRSHFFAKLYQTADGVAPTPVCSRGERFQGVHGLSVINKDQLYLPGMGE